jgi:hypothetical protein
VWAVATVRLIGPENFLIRTSGNRALSNFISSEMYGDVADIDRFDIHESLDDLQLLMNAVEGVKKTFKV